MNRKAEQGMSQMRQRPQKSQRGEGVVVVGDAEVEVAKEVLVHEVEPEPAADISAMVGKGNEPVTREAVGIPEEVEGGRESLGWDWRGRRGCARGRR